MVRALLVSWLLVACGNSSSAPPPAAPVPATAAATASAEVPAVPAVAPAAAGVTPASLGMPPAPPAPVADPRSPCFEVERAQRAVAREALVAALRESCLHDGWPADAAPCFVSATTDPQTERCVIALGAAVKARLHERVRRAMRAGRPDAMECGAFVKHVGAWFELASIADPGERAFAAGFLPSQIAGMYCGIERDRACFEAATTAEEEAACIPTETRDGITQWWTTKFRPDLVVAHRRPPTCAATAAHYQSNERWYEDRNPSLHGGGRADDSQIVPNRMRAHSAATQRQLMTAARAQLQTACEREQWSPWVRACIAAAWMPAMQAGCLDAIDGSPARRRRFTAPPLELVEARVPACDAYLAAARALVVCKPADRIDRAIADAVEWAAHHTRAAGPAADPYACAERHREVVAAVAHCRK